MGASPRQRFVLTTTLGRTDEANARFAESVGSYEKLGAGPWLARAQLDWARTLLARRSSDNEATSKSSSPRRRRLRKNSVWQRSSVTLRCS